MKQCENIELGSVTPNGNYIVVSEAYCRTGSNDFTVMVGTGQEVVNYFMELLDFPEVAYLEELEELLDAHQSREEDHYSIYYIN